VVDASPRGADVQLPSRDTLYACRAPQMKRSRQPFSAYRRARHQDRQTSKGCSAEAPRLGARRGAGYRRGCGALAPRRRASIPEPQFSQTANLLTHFMPNQRRGDDFLPQRTGRSRRFEAVADLGPGPRDGPSTRSCGSRPAASLLLRSVGTVQPSAEVSLGVRAVRPSAPRPRDLQRPRSSREVTGVSGRSSRRRSRRTP
jgi:hypothetical protein